MIFSNKMNSSRNHWTRGMSRELKVNDTLTVIVALSPFKSSFPFAFRFELIGIGNEGIKQRAERHAIWCSARSIVDIRVCVYTRDVGGRKGSSKTDRLFFSSVPEQKRKIRSLPSFLSLSLSLLRALFSCLPI